MGFFPIAPHMARFVKTRIHVVSAVLFLVFLYALAGIGYSAWTGSSEAAITWAVIAGVALLAALAYQQLVAKKKGPSP